MNQFNLRCLHLLQSKHSLNLQVFDQLLQVNQNRHYHKDKDKTVDRLRLKELAQMNEV